MIKAKAILKDKFWIIENNGERLGTLAADETHFVYSTKKGVNFFKNKSQLERNIGKIEFDAEKHEIATVSLETHGYPTNTVPYNTMYDIKSKLPLFTKSDKSKSVYCAGYYIIHFDKGWVKSFCPKLITLGRYDFKGPFKTEFEMKQELSRANKNSN